MSKREKKRPKSLRKIFIAGAAFALSACAIVAALSCKGIFGHTETTSGIPLEAFSAQTRFPIRLSNGKAVYVRLALTDIERMRGLMGCRKLEENEGMLFVYPTAEQRAFWMKNVPIDLDIGYFASSGKLLEVYTMRARDTASVYSQSHDIRYCLEMNRGWFEKNKIRPEDDVSIDCDSLEDALQKRGFRR